MHSIAFLPTASKIAFLPSKRLAPADGPPNDFKRFSFIVLVLPSLLDPQMDFTDQKSSERHS